MVLGRMHQRLDNSRRDSVHAHAIFSMFYGQASRRGVEKLFYDLVGLLKQISAM